jgi:hypothetical protein
LDDAELLASGNPIDLTFYAAKCALSGPEELQKYMYLWTLAGLLAERGWVREDKRDLTLFIERFIYLRDEKLKEQYWNCRQELNKEGKIMCVSFLKDVEKRITKEEGRKEGKEEGRKEGEMEGRKEAKEEVARNLLNCGVSADITAKNGVVSRHNPGIVRETLIRAVDSFPNKIFAVHIQLSGLYFCALLCKKLQIGFLGLVLEHKYIKKKRLKTAVFYWSS